MEEVAYKPSTNVKASQANINPTFSQPAYEDVGIKYQGFSKTKLASNKWQLNRQTTRFITINLGSGAFGSTLFDRPNPDLKFFCSKMFVQWYSLDTFSLSFGKIQLADVTGTNASARWVFFPNMAAGNLLFDFSDCPREFSGDKFDLYTQASFAAADFLVITLFGWEE